MHTGNVTTPFGRRPMTYGMLADQLHSLNIDEDASVDKWKLYRWLCEARSRLGVSDRALSLLNALLTFYPKTELAAEDSLIVFPSNAQLSLRAHGMAEATIRRHLAALVSAGLLVRRDSANGKRFARRNGEGSVGEAFGFSLAMLLARAGELERLAADVAAQRLQYQSNKERLTICRRDVTKLLDAASEQFCEDQWSEMKERFRLIMAQLPRQPELEMLVRVLADMEKLRNDIANAMIDWAVSQNKNGNHDHSERHKQNSNTNITLEFEPRFEPKQGGKSETNPHPATVPYPSGNRDKESAHVEGRSVSYAAGHLGQPVKEDGLKPFPLGMVLSACPEILNYGPNSGIGNWREMMSAAVIVRSMLGVSPSAYQEACSVMGPENAATVIACILERAGHINSAGGYLRDLTRRAERGEFSLGPVLMAQMRANGDVGKRRA